MNSNIVHLVGFTIEICHDARSHERQSRIWYWTKKKVSFRRLVSECYDWMQRTVQADRLCWREVSCNWFVLTPHPQWTRASSFTRFLDHTQRLTTVGRTHVDERWARRRDICLTTHNNHNIPTYMPPVGFEPTISEGERPQTCAFDRAATGIGMQSVVKLQ